MIKQNKNPAVDTLIALLFVCVSLTIVQADASKHGEHSTTSAEMVTIDKAESMDPFSAAALSEDNDPFAEDTVSDCEACANPDLNLEHDHGTDHGPSAVEIGNSQGGPSFLSRLARYIGKLHPMVVHFPIALILAAALAELLFAFTTLDSMRQAARFTLAMAALTAPLAACMGWLNADVANYPGTEHILFYHRWVGISTAVLAVLAFLFQCLVKTSSPSQRIERFYRVVLFLCVLFVSVAGHLGASLIYGVDYLLTF